MIATGMATPKIAAPSPHPVLEEIPVRAYAAGPDYALIQGNCLTVLPEFPADRPAR